MIRLLVTTCLLLLALTPRLYAESDTLSLLVVDSEPHSFKDASGHWRGLTVDQARALADAAGLRLVCMEVPWNRALKYLQTGQLDLIGQLSKSPERETFVHFLGESFVEQVVLVVRPDFSHPPLQTLDDLTAPGMLWGIRNSVFYSRDFNTRLRQDPQFARHFESASKAHINLRKVRSNRLTGLFAYQLNYDYSIKTGTLFDGLIALQVPFFPPQPAYFGITRRMPPEKMARVQKAFDKLQAQGVFADIVRRWTR